MKVKIESFSIEQAELSAAILKSTSVEGRRCKCCHQINWNDVLIAGHFTSMVTVFVTDNPKDFHSFFDSKTVMTTEEVLQRFGDRAMQRSA